MLGGTGSDVGKSILVAGLCRIFRQDGLDPVPFKAQNMALNSYVTPDGLEIGRAQAVQAWAAGLDCMVDMNPVLLKPTADRYTQVVLLGQPAGNREACEYFNVKSQEPLRRIVVDAFHRLEKNFNPVVMEGAGSVAELNLLDRDIVNMPMAEAADAAVILVADINRGGVFAQVYGSIMLLPERYRKRIKGIIINKFRGNAALFEDGRRMIESLCGVPVLGVVPYFHDLDIEEEDSLSAGRINRKATDDNLVNVAVGQMPGMSNFTDFDLMSRDPRIHLYFTSDPLELRRADVIILPGSKATIRGLEYLRHTGCDRAVSEAAGRGKTVIGICGGYQMLGLTVADPTGVEGKAVSVEGLGLLPVNTILTPDKRLTRSVVGFTPAHQHLEGYEIHMGRTSLEEGCHPMFYFRDGEGEGCRVSEKLWGTYIHGILDNPELVDRVIGEYARKKSLPPVNDAVSQRQYREQQFDRLAAGLRECLDMEALYEIMRQPREI